MKVLNIQDVHASPKWIEESKKHIERICEVAKSEQVDAIMCAGDFFDRQVVASDENNWNDILNMARDLQEAAPVYFVSGTPGHDSPGCYSSFKDIGWKEISIGKSEVVGDLLVMGIPEITPAFIIANNPELSRAEAIAKQYEIVKDLIDKYYAPLAANHNGPVQFVFHGHVSGAKFRDDQKPRTSEFMYSEEMLNRLKADFIQAGHIHLPQTFCNGRGRYGGSAHVTWNDLNFKPGFDVVDYAYNNKLEMYAVNIDRFDYGEPARKKIVIKNIEDISTLIPRDMPLNGENLWIDIECDKSFAEAFDKDRDLEGLKSEYNIGPLSKITCNIQHVDNVRVDTEEYEKANTLEDIYKIFDPEVSDSIIGKVNEMEESISGESAAEEKHEFHIEYLYLKGTKAGMENGVEEIEIDFNEFKTGASIIEGANGTGKSFTLGFIPPFSEHLPKGDDFKTLFELKDSQIIRRYRSGEKVITQKILIDPTLSTPSAKYHMDIDGEVLPGLSGNKGPFDDAVEKIFGSIKMFMTCAFRGQKENSNYPSLENAKETDLRKIFSEIAGIDRAVYKEFSHEKVKEIERNIELKTSEKETLSGIVEDVTALESSKSDKETELYSKEEEKKTAAGMILSRREKLEGIEKEILSNDSVNGSVSRLENEKESSEKSISNTDQDLHRLRVALGGANETRKALATMESNNIQAFTSQEKLSSIQGKYSSDLKEWSDSDKSITDKLESISDDADKIKGVIDKNEKQISTLTDFISLKEKEIDLLNTPCEFCKKIPSSSESEITALKKMIVDSEKAREDLVSDNIVLNPEIEKLRETYKSVRASIKKPPEEPEEINSIKEKIKSLSVDHDSLERKRSEVKELDSINDRMKTAETSKEELKLKIQKIDIEVSEFKKQLKEIDYGAVSALRSKITADEEKINSASSEIGRISAEIAATIKRIEKANGILEDIKVIDSELVAAQGDCSDWSRIEEAFSPKGIPALELSMAAPKIAHEANRLLSTYGSRFKIEIITQEARKKDMIEKFKILVHDSYSSAVKNLPNMSGGQGVWITKAIQEAATKTYSERSGRKYLFSIMDEADAALDGEAIAAFYEMMDNAMDGERMLISVSHSAEAKAAVQNVVDITKFFKGYGE